MGDERNRRGISKERKGEELMELFIDAYTLIAIVALWSLTRLVIEYMKK